MSQKNRDEKNRWRNKTIAFRMSPQEAELLDKYVRLSGLTKQDYLISRTLQRNIEVVGNPRVYKALRNEMTAILSELQRMKHCSEAQDEFLSILQQVTVIVNGMKEGSR